MAISVDASSATIKFHNQQVKPTVDIKDSRVLVGNLTNNYVSKNQVAQAFTADGIVNISKSGGSSLSGWQFGFIQFQRINKLEIYYAGAQSNHGAVGLFPAKGSAMSALVTLDSNPQMIPWTEPQSKPRYKESGGKVEAETGDHPMIMLPHSITNSATSQPNYAFHFIDDRSFWTVFTYEDSSGTRTYMMHYEWSLRYEFMMRWESGKPKIHKDRGAFSMQKPRSGAPTEPALKNLLANPQPPLSNIEMPNGLKNAVTGGQGPSRKDLDRRYGNVPPNFWT